MEVVTTEKAPEEKSAAPMYREKGRTLIRNLPKIGRNDPCPCGSGKKFKKCCYAVTETEVGAGAESERLSDFANPDCTKCMGRGHRGFHIAQGKRFVSLCTATGCARETLSRYMAMKKIKALQERAEEAKRKVLEHNDEGRIEDLSGDGSTGTSEGVGNDLPVEEQKPISSSDTGPSDECGEGDRRD